ncbi:MAG: NAD(P)/FAD-dependent oxidoreductase, partial [Candidatus Hodgkinia cicadicola]
MSAHMPPMVTIKPQTMEVNETDRLESTEVNETDLLESAEVDETDRFESEEAVSAEEETAMSKTITSTLQKVTNSSKDELSSKLVEPSAKRVEPSAKRVEPSAKLVAATAEADCKREVATAEAAPKLTSAPSPLEVKAETSRATTERPNSNQQPPAERLVILGSGLAGYSAATAACSLNTLPLLITGPILGGTLASPGNIDFWPGAAPNAKSSELATALHAQAARLGTKFMFDSVQSIDINVYPYIISTKQGGLLSASAIIVATGLTPKTLNLPGEADLLGRSVFTSAASINGPHKDAAIVGNDSYAIAEALTLSKMVSKVTLICNAPQLSAPPSLISQLSQTTNIRVECNAEVFEYITEDFDGGPLLWGLAIKRSNEMFVTDASVTVLALGFEPKVDLLPSEAKTADGFIKSNIDVLNLKGLFAAGTIIESIPDQQIMISASGFAASTAAVRFLSSTATSEVVVQQPATAVASITPEAKLAEAEAKAPASVPTSPSTADVTSKPASAGKQSSAVASGEVPVSLTSAASAAMISEVTKPVPPE